jgi:hypothetical protein
MIFNSGGDDIRGHRYPGHRGAVVPPVCYPETVVGRRVGDVLAHDAVLAPHWTLDKDGYTRFVVLSSFFCFNFIPGSYYILIHVIICFTDVGPLHQSHAVRIVAYWIVTLSFTCTLWAARMSMLFSIIRITPTLLKAARYMHWLVVFFLAMWAALVMQKTILCATDKKWYHDSKPQCRLGHRVGILELSSQFCFCTSRRRVCTTDRWSPYSRLCVRLYTAFRPRQVDLECVDAVRTEEAVDCGLLR